MLIPDRHLFRLMSGSDELGALPPFNRLSFTDEDMGRGLWSFTAPLDGNRDTFGDWVESQWPGLMVWSPESGARSAGMLTEYTVTEEAQGATIHASGISWLGLLDDRIIWPDFNLDLAEIWNHQAYTSNGTDNEIAHEWVRQILEADLYDPVDGAVRRLPILATLDNLTLADVTGPISAIRTEAMPTMQRIGELLGGTDSHVRMTPEADAQGQITARFAAGVRPVAGTPLSVSEQTVGEVSYTRRAATATRVFGVGAEIGAGPDREITQNFNLLPDNWERRYVELLSNQLELSGTNLAAAVASDLVSAAPSNSIVASNPQAGLWGNDLGVGWLVPVAVTDVRGAAEYVDLPVVASTLTADADGGQTRTIELGGRERTNLSGVFAAIGDIQRRLQRTERRV